MIRGIHHFGLTVRDVGARLTRHRHGSQDAFDETRAGLDHLAFTVADREELDAWATPLADAAVVHSPVTAANSVPGAAVADPEVIPVPPALRHRRGQRQPPLQ
jgi:hypothetical protein